MPAWKVRLKESVINDLRDFDSTKMVVTIILVGENGRPSFQLVPLNQHDDLIDQLLAEHADFREMLEKRLSEPSVSPATALRRLKSNSRPARRA